MRKSTYNNNHKKGDSVPFWKAIVIIISGILISVGITSLFYSAYKILDYKEFDVYIKVTEKNEIGFNLDPGVFNFGKIPRGFSARRNATVFHQYPYDIKVKIDILGEVKGLVYAQENYFILPPNTSKQIEIKAFIPENQSIGNYTGKLRVYFIK